MNIAHMKVGTAPKNIVKIGVSVVPNAMSINSPCPIHKASRTIIMAMNTD
jgi:hypothetical protein